MTVTLESIQDAARRLAGHVVRTPCHRSETLSAITDDEIYLKFENHQVTA